MAVLTGNPSAFTSERPGAGRPGAVSHGRPTWGRDAPGPRRVDGQLGGITEVPRGTRLAQRGRGTTMSEDGFTLTLDLEVAAIAAD